MSQPQQVDILIIGSGPAGMSTALHLVRQDPSWAKRMIIVDRAVHPREKLCGGGITPIGTAVLQQLGLPFEPKHFSVREVRLVFQKYSYSFHGDPAIRIVRRDEFDHWLVQTGEKKGIEVRQGEAVTDIIPQNGFVEVVTTKNKYQAKVLVAADGSRSFVRRRLKWDDDSRVARLLEVLTAENDQEQPEFRSGVAIFDFTPMIKDLQGYYWDFPSYVQGRPFMNRGVFDSRTRPERPRADLKETLRKAMNERDRNLDNYELKGHPIRWFDKNGRFAMPHILLTGDAAGADPLFGEGISFALGYGEITAQAIMDAFQRQDFNFTTYRQRLLAHPLIRHLQQRVRLARFAYWINKYPLFVGLGWRMARWVIRLTPWNSPTYQPDIQLFVKADSGL